MEEVLKKIRTSLYSLKHFRSEALPLQHVEPTHEVKKHKAPFSVEQMCAMRPHDFDCPIIGCKKDPCFVRVPDKVSRKKRVCKEVKDRVEGQKILNQIRLDKLRKEK